MVDRLQGHRRGMERGPLPRILIAIDFYLPLTLFVTGGDLRSIAKMTKKIVYTKTSFIVGFGDIRYAN